MNYETFIADSRLAFVSGQNDKALELAKQAIKACPQEAEGYKAAADACMSLENYTQAVDYYKEAIKYDPNNGNRYFNYGYALVATGKTADALKALTRAAEYKCTKENRAQLYHLLGIMCFDIGKYDDALINLKKAEQIMGPNLEIMQRMAVIYGLKEDIRNGVFIANQMKMVSPSEYTGYKAAFTFLCQMKRYKEALTELQKAAKYVSPNMDYYFDYMTYELEMYSQTDDKSYLEKALSHLDIALKTLKPSVNNVVDAYINSAEIYLQAERPDDVMRCLNAALNPADSFNLGFDIIVKESEGKSLTEYDVEEMMEKDRIYLEENYGPDGIEELVASVEPDEDGARDYLTVLEDYNNAEEKEEKAESEEIYKLSKDDTYTYSPDMKDQINMLFMGAYTLKNEFEKVKEYALKLQKSEKQYNVYIGKYTYVNALKKLGSPETISKYEELIRYFRNAVLKDNTDFAATIYRVRCLIDIEKYDEAREICTLLPKEVRAGLFDEIEKSQNGGEV